MQGNLNEIDIRSILQLIELGQRTGTLFVEAYTRHENRVSLEQKSWFVFFLNGQIVYVANSDSNLSRLRDYLHHYRLDTDLEYLLSDSWVRSNHLPEYAYLWALLEHNLITPVQGRSIIQNIVYETLFELLSLHEGSFVFHTGTALTPQLTTIETGSLVGKIMKQLQEWKLLHQYIQSPNQCPVITDIIHLRQALPKATFNHLENWADGKTSLQQLARYLNRDILSIAKAIYPFVQQGWIKLLEPSVSKIAINTKDLDVLHLEKIPRLVCIEQAIATSRSVEFILKQQGYDAIGLNNSLAALSLVFQLKPDLIFCDTAMPELNGYELCAMLRRTNAFRHTPIIMLTDKDQFIAQVKAQIVEATYYLAKPFTDSELLTLVDKYVNLSRIHVAKQKFSTIADKSIKSLTLPPYIY